MSTAAVPVAAALPATRFADYVQLTRPRMSVLVLLTVLIGGLLASVGAAPADRIVNAVLSTALVSAAASALNQWMERDTDARMRRTANRPLPAGRLSPAEVFAFGAVTAAVGFLYQVLTLPPAAVAVTAFTFGSYLLLYTPAKTRTSLNTLVGAVPGALPPVIGWAAVRGQLDADAGWLFLIVFVWQVPHFLAIAWMYRDEYERAGHKMLTAGDATGRRTARQMLLYLLTLLPVSLLAGAALGAGVGFALGALALTAYFLRPVLAFRRAPSRASAKDVLLASLAYLPGVLGLLLAAKYLTTF